MVPCPIHFLMFPADSPGPFLFNSSSDVHIHSRELLFRCVAKTAQQTLQAPEWNMKQSQSLEKVMIMGQ